MTSLGGGRPNYDVASVRIRVNVEWIGRRRSGTLVNAAYPATRLCIGPGRARKMENSACVIGTLCLIGIFYVGSAVGELDSKYPTSIQCYQCNSEYDPRCGDPFDPYSLGTVNCSLKKRLEHLPDMPPIICRKTVQKVQGHTRIIRGCGYIPDKRDDKQCVRRTGTHEVLLHYCSCTKDLCNTGLRSVTVNLSLIFATLIGLFKFRLD